ncbi:MAG: MarR family transcriptional regulator [Magnetococcales bacterium]|nr:MarR family transcriptional regulator [Magnetococcales bacterium]
MLETTEELIALHRANWPESLDAPLMGFVFSLLRAREVHFRRVGEVLARHRLSPAQFDVLASLRRSPPPWELTPMGLQQAVLLTSGGLTKILKELEERGLVVRSTREGDRRVKPVRLSEQGVQLAQRAIREVRAEVGGWLHQLYDEEEMRRMGQLLGRMMAADRQSPDAVQDP